MVDDFIRTKISLAVDIHLDGSRVYTFLESYSFPESCPELGVLYLEFIFRMDADGTMLSRHVQEVTLAKNSPAA